MRLFSILQSGIDVKFSSEPDAQVQTLDFSQDPEDSSIVRLRITPPAGADEAVEIEFDRHGRERSRRMWHMKYPAWDKRDPAVIDKEDALMSEQAAADAKAADEQAAKIEAAQAEKVQAAKRDRAGAGKGKDR